MNISITQLLMVIAVFFFTLNYAFATPCPNFIHINGTYNYRDSLKDSKVYIRVSSIIAIKTFKDNKYYVEKHGSSLYINKSSYIKLKECLK